MSNGKEQAHLSYEQEKIAKYLKRLRFQPKLFGVDQADVWKKIAALNELYEQALRAERERYDHLLEQYAAEAAGDAQVQCHGERGDVYGEIGLR